MVILIPRGAKNAKDPPSPPKVDFFLKRPYSIEDFLDFLWPIIWFWSQKLPQMLKPPVSR